MENCPNWEFSRENIICVKDNSSMVDEKAVTNIDWCTIDSEIHPGSMHFSVHFAIMIALTNDLFKLVCIFKETMFPI